MDSLEQAKLQEAPTHDVTLDAQTTRGSRSFTFPRTIKVHDAIDVIVLAFGFTPGDSFHLVLGSNPSEPLDPNRPLVSYHLADGTKVILTAVGGGV